jgi:RND family efflux transporter MFP subunit
VGRDVRSSPALLSVALSVALAACTPPGGDDDDEGPRPPPPAQHEAGGVLRLAAVARAALDLATAPAALGTLPDSALRFGRVQARLGEDAVVVAPVAGRLAAAPAVALGDAVTAGQTLAFLVPALSAAERVSLRVQGATLGGQVAVAAREATEREAVAVRLRALAQDDVVSRARLQEAETALAVARAQLAAAARARTAATDGDAAGALPLRAPAAGTVVAFVLTVGSVVPAGAVVARLVRAGPRWIDLAVPADDAIGEGYELSFGPRTIPARLLARGGAVEDDGARHDRLEAFDADLLPGAIVAVRVARGPSTGVLVPEAAVVPGIGGDGVYVEAPPGAFTLRPVRVAARFGGQARLAEGLRAGEIVVTRGAMALRSEGLRDALGDGD